MGKEEDWIEDLYKNAKRYDGGFSIKTCDIAEKIDDDQAARLYPNTDFCDYDNAYDYDVYIAVADLIRDLYGCSEYFDYEGDICFKK